MTGPELKQLRHDLSEATGRRLSLSDMARIAGLKDPDRNGKDTFRKWEDGEGPSGPVAALMSLFAYALPHYELPKQVEAAGVEMLRGQIRDDGAATVQEVYRAMIGAEIRRRLEAR